MALNGSDDTQRKRFGLFRVALAAKPLDKAGAHADLAEALLKAGQTRRGAQAGARGAADRADLQPGRRTCC